MFDTGTTAVVAQSGQTNIWITLLLLVAIVWGVVWKGIGMWRAAKKGQRNWFIAMLVLNTLGIVPIVYLKFYQKKS